MATFVEGGSVDPKDRLLHVGIDYTQYVTEDGTELKTKEYDIHDKETFDGYEFVETRTAENGDTVHVYKKVTTPTPEPEQPVTPTNPTDETPVVPNNPTDNTVVPPTVEEKPVVEEKPAENTIVNKVEENIVVNNTNSSTTSIKKDDRVIETGVRTNAFTNLAMTVISGLGLLGLALKKKESK